MIVGYSILKLNTFKHKEIHILPLYCEKREKITILAKFCSFTHFQMHHIVMNQIFAHKYVWTLVFNLLRQTLVFPFIWYQSFKYTTKIKKNMQDFVPKNFPYSRSNSSPIHVKYIARISLKIMIFAILGHKLQKKWPINDRWIGYP